MSLSQMEVFNKYFMGPTIETLAEMVELFNEASGGAIVMTAEGFEGDMMQESFFAAIHGAQRRVNRYQANADQAATDLTQLSHNSIKVAGGFGPIRYEPSQMTWLSKPTAEGIEVASRNFAEAMLKDQLHTAIACLVAAIGNNANTLNDLSTDGISYAGLNSGHAKFGDQSGSLVTEIMRGSVRHRLIGANLDNSERLFVSNGVTVVDILGKVAVFTDAPALFDASTTPDQDKVLSLTAAAATVSDGGDMISNIETKNGKERIETTMQVDYSFGVGLKGYSFDPTIKSPTDAQLATGTNWTKVATSDKHTAGVLTVGNAEAA